MGSEGVKLSLGRSGWREGGFTFVFVPHQPTEFSMAKNKLIFHSLSLFCPTHDFFHLVFFPCPAEEGE